ncbi:Alkaline phosphatase synthesis sensor protein PhoR [Paenibacillus konkukensis]|uniref:histidine kinase n=1 Tax=Paenibacillus konkukensis TaxID=2020716 RepID=A0ABY4RXB4_9BACL|nr:sensor histidine kinase [Paenibacillus konkukensis]UQZ86389.1 Alkaline phosphatase synthesis sensor protein PhoR [Paenibacillus konkukensis]
MAHDKLAVKSLLILFISVACCCANMLLWPTAPAAASPEAPLSPPMSEAAGGTLDLSGWNPEERGTVRLNGEWELYWRRLLEPRDLSAGVAEPDAYARVPGTWGQYRIGGESLGNQGYGTYHLTLLLPPGAVSDTTLGLYIPHAASAYKLWVDGRLLGGKGTVGASREQMIAGNAADTYYFVPSGPRVELTIQVSNFVQRKGGLWDEIRLGSKEQIARISERKVVLQTLLSGCLLIMGLYHLILYVQRRKDRSTLYFGGLCAVVGVRTLFVGDTVAVQLFPAIPWELGVKLEYLGAIYALPLFAAYAESLYPKELSRRLLVWIVWTACAGSLFVLAAEARLYTLFMLPLQLFIMAVFGYIACVYAAALRRKREWSGLSLVSLAAIIATALNDTLYYNRLINTGDLFPYGVLAAVFIQAYILSVRFSRSLVQVEKLSGQMAALTGTLELKIKKRTEQLEKSNRELQNVSEELIRLEKSRRRLLSNISHELGTPLTLIQGYVSAMMDGVVPPGDARTLKLVLDKSEMMDRIIGDLSELSKLESGQVRFRFIELDPLQLLYDIYERYETDIRSGGLEFTIRAAPCPSGTYVPVIWADPARLEQVFVNFLFNARKHTPAGGSIALELEWVWPKRTKAASSPRVVFKVADTGAGIRPEDAPRVFNRYFQAGDREQVNRTGVGLGLAIAKEIVGYHKGKIGVHSVPGSGSTFYFSLPLRMKQDNDASDSADGLSL